MDRKRNEALTGSGEEEGGWEAEAGGSLVKSREDTRVGELTERGVAWEDTGEGGRAEPATARVEEGREGEQA